MKLETAITLGALLGAAMSAGAAEIRVMSGGAPQEALAVLTPEFEKLTGHKVIFTFAVITELRKRIAEGARPDMVLMPVPVIDGFVKEQRMRADARATLGSVGIAVIVREGAALPDISTPEAFRKALLDARAVVHATPTATPSGAHMAKVIEQLGITDAMQKKLIYRPALDGGVGLVAKGEAEIGMYPTSEVSHVKGVTVVGPLPAALQSITIYGAAVMTGNTSPDPALAFVKFLADPANREHWRHAGFAPPGN